MRMASSHTLLLRFAVPIVFCHPFALNCRAGQSSCVCCLAQVGPLLCTSLHCHAADLLVSGLADVLFIWFLHAASRARMQY
jgi:hypothetical protein